MALQLPQPPSTEYTDLRLLSKSKFHTYQAFDQERSQSVVLKVFPSKDAVNIKYHNEKAVLSVLQHQNIIKLLGSNDMSTTPTKETEDKTSYLVLEHAVYGDLLEIVLKYGRMPEELARTVFQQVIQAISYMHTHNIAHLDIKMENLLLDSDYTVKLADFDLSQPLDATKLEGSGTPGSRAPEVRKGVCQDFRAADLYSAGIVLFALVAGQTPYTEVESCIGSGYDKLHKFFRTNNQRFWDLHSGYLGNADLFSEDFKKLIIRMLSEDPNERPTAEDVKCSNWLMGSKLGEDEYRIEMKKYLRE